MLKKIICVCAGVLLAILELALFKVPPLEALSSMILPVGFTAVFLIWYTDFIVDRRCTVLMWVCYGCALLAVALVGASLKLNRTVMLVVGAIFGVAAVVCYLIDKHIYKNKRVD